MVKSTSDTNHSFRSIKSTLLFAFLFVSISILFINTIIIIPLDIQHGIEDIIKEQQFVSKSASSVVKEFITAKIRILQETTVIGNLENISTQQQSLILNRVLKNDSAFRQIALYDNSKHLLTKSSRLSNFAYDNFFKQFSDSVFLDIQKPEHTYYISNVYIDKETNEPLILMIVPVRDVFGTFKGALVSEINLKFMWDLVSNLTIGKNGFAYVVDADGYLIASKDTSLVLKRKNIKYLKEVSEFISYSLTDQKDGMEATGQNTKGIYGTDVVSTYVTISSQPKWAMITEVPTTEAYYFIYKQLIISAIILVLSLVIIIFFSLFLSKKITTPIIKLRDAAKQISLGKLDASMDVSTNNEIGELAETFNQMTQKLKEYYEGLEQRIQEKTSELAKKVGETERINKFMLGRELKMVELKKENEKLREALEKQKQTKQ